MWWLAPTSLAIWRSLLCGSRRLTAQEMAASEDLKPALTTPKLRPEGGRPKKNDNLDIVRVSHQGGTSAAYLVAKLKRDAPEIAERVRLCRRLGRKSGRVYQFFSRVFAESAGDDDRCLIGLG